ncbi:MAG: DUF29 domain-containing protein [Planctomycetaceae bacterium]|nr:DUF29 domain-containing protein [Planctomycetaceae bacterium]MBV8607623.1 DUF29 domain-containing protein [Singulisphaera sp.]
MKSQASLSELYETDETAWLDRHVELIAAGRHSEIDWEDLREFLESMANRDRRRVTHRLTLLIEHILKWDYQPTKRTRSWARTIVAQQISLADDVSAGSLRRHAVEVPPVAYRKAVALASVATGMPAETFPTASPWSLDALLAYRPK